MAEKTLIDVESYLKTGSHIGTKFKSGEMRRYILKVRKDGLNVLDIQKIDERIKLAAKFIARYAPEELVVVSRKLYGQTPAKEFAKIIGAKEIVGRFVPGTFTNPTAKKFIEPKILLVTEAEPDSQAITEARKIRIPVIALSSTNNSLKNVDFIIPVNNKGRKSLALVYWLLAREYLKERGEIKSDDGFTKSLEDFEYKMKEGERDPSVEERPRRFYDRNRRDDRGGGRGRR